MFGFPVPWKKTKPTKKKHWSEISDSLTHCVVSKVCSYLFVYFCINQFRGIKFFDPSDDEEDEKEVQKIAVPAKPEPPKTEDKECWTNEPDCEKYV